MAEEGRQDSVVLCAPVDVEPGRRSEHWIFEWRGQLTRKALARGAHPEIVMSFGS